MNGHPYQYVEIKEHDGHYRVYLKNSTFIGSYTKSESLLVAYIIERTLKASLEKHEKSID